MRKRSIMTAGAVCSVALALSACGSGSSNSSSASGSASSSGGGSATLKVGVLTSLSGPASAASAPTVDGVNARFQAYKASSGKCASSVTFDVIKADDQSSPQGALAGVQKLVQQDKVYAVIEESGLFFGAAPWAASQGASTPVIGGAFDGAAEWKKSPQNNLFPNFPVIDQTKVSSTTGEYFASVKATKVAAIAYNSPSSQAGAENGLKSIEAAGLKRGYVNNTVPFGSTDVGAIILGIKNSGSDALALSINPDTAFAIIGGLKQANYPLKAIVSATGYGGDLLQSKPAIQAGQGVTFTNLWAPVEAKTPATQYFSDAMKKYGNTPSGVPGFFATMGWFGADVLIHGLEKAGCDADSKTFLSTVRKDSSWDAGGLYPGPIPFNSTEYSKVNCAYFLKLTGNDFVPIPQQSPLCGKTLG